MDYYNASIYSLSSLYQLKGLDTWMQLKVQTSNISTHISTSVSTPPSVF